MLLNQIIKLVHHMQCPIIIKGSLFFNSKVLTTFWSFHIFYSFNILIIELTMRFWNFYIKFYAFNTKFRIAFFFWLTNWRSVVVICLKILFFFYDLLKLIMKSGWDSRLFFDDICWSWPLAKLLSWNSHILNLIYMWSSLIEWIRSRKYLRLLSFQNL